jgi:hypothetical protein
LLHQDIEDVPILIDDPPEVRAHAVDRQKCLIEVPRVAGLGAPAPELIGIRLAEFPALFAHRPIHRDNSACEQQLFAITIAEAEANVEPAAVADDFSGKAVVFVAHRGHTFLPFLFADMIGTEDSALAEIMPHWARIGGMVE